MPKISLKYKKPPNWYVITGGPSSGKTTVLNELAKLGYYTIPDVARIYINRETAKGKSIKEIRGSEAEFQRKILEIKIKIEERVPRNKIIFFDNAIPCSIAYYQVCGLDPKEVLKFCKKKIYRKIFFLKQIPFEKDYARTEDGKTVKKLNKLLKEGYENLGYKVIKIPAISVRERVKAILKELKEI